MDGREIERDGGGGGTSRKGNFLFPSSGISPRGAFVLIEPPIARYHRRSKRSWQ